MSPNESGRPLRRSLLLAICLLALTIGTGGAVRMAQSAAVAGAPPANADLAFEASTHGPVHFSGHLDRGAVLTGGDGLVRMELSLRADAAAGALPARVPSDLVVVLDRSGSMAGAKLEHARAAIFALLERLGPRDRFALVTYSDGAELRLPLMEATAAARASWRSVIDAVSPSGGTNMAAGLDLGLGTVDVARRDGRSPRVILISDGLANQGDVSREGLRGRAARAAAGEYALSTVGVGLDFDEELMASLADAGTGNFHYLENTLDLSEIFAAELATARETVATAVTIRFAPEPGVSLVEAAGYPIERDTDGTLALKPGSLFAGQDRRVWLTLRVAPNGPASQTLGAFSASYRMGAESGRLAFSELPRIRRVGGEGEFYAQLDSDRWSKAVVVDEYNRLQRAVAADLKQGKAEEARQKILSYGSSVGAMNQHVRSPAVEKQLAAAKDLASTVAAAAEAPAPERARTAKQLQADALMGARPGSAK
jgi:Ca-activated chloride channel family protein